LQWTGCHLCCMPVSTGFVSGVIIYVAAMSEPCQEQQDTASPYEYNYCAAVTATGYRLDGWGVGVRVPVESKTFLLSMSTRLALGPTQPPLIPWAQSGRGAKLTIHLQLVPRSRIRRSIQPLPHTSSWYSA
jgi:hypothetical protein